MTYLRSVIILIGILLCSSCAGGTTINQAPLPNPPAGTEALEMQIGNTSGKERFVQVRLPDNSVAWESEIETYTVIPVQDEPGVEKYVTVAQLEFGERATVEVREMPGHELLYSVEFLSGKHKLQITVY